MGTPPSPAWNQVSAPGAKKEREGISSSRFNNTVTTLRQILKIGFETGIITVTPVQEIKRARVIQKNWCFLLVPISRNS